VNTDRGERFSRRKSRKRTGGSTRAGGVAPGPEHVEYVETVADLERVCARAARASEYAIDTEFHRERTYYPQLALVQLHWEDEDGPAYALIDPLTLRQEELAGALRDLLVSPATAITHAAQQDIEILENLTGERPSRLFDCQLAAGFLGYSTPSLATLAQSLVGVSIAKGERLTDWLVRPLTEQQKLYAINDVLHLPAIAGILRERLTRRGRSAWAEEACEELRLRPVPGTDPDDAWTRIKEARSLRGEALGAAQAIAAWRDRRARRIDQPVRRVLSDMAVVSIAQKLPTNSAEMSRIRGVNPGQIGGERERELLAAVAEGRRRTVTVERTGYGNGRHTRTSATMLNAWIGELARREQIDPVLIATRDDVENFLERGVQAIRGGWRRELIGDDLERLSTGRAALALDADGYLRLVTLDR